MQLPFIEATKAPTDWPFLVLPSWYTSIPIHISSFCKIITDRIRSMGEGYAFTGICLFTVREGAGAWLEGVVGCLVGGGGVGAWSAGGGGGGGCVVIHPPATSRYGQPAVGTHPTEIHSCSKDFLLA